LSPTISSSSSQGAAPQTDADRNAIAFGFTGGVASINVEETPPWALLSTEEKDNTAIGPDVLNAVKNGTTNEPFFKDWITNNSNVAPFATALESVNC